MGDLISCSESSISKGSWCELQARATRRGQPQIYLITTSRLHTRNVVLALSVMLKSPQNTIKMPVKFRLINARRFLSVVCLSVDFTRWCIRYHRQEHAMGMAEHTCR